MLSIAIIEPAYAFLETKVAPLHMVFATNVYDIPSRAIQIQGIECIWFVLVGFPRNKDK